MKKISTFMIGALMVLATVIGVSALDGFLYQKEINVTNNVAENLTNYEVRLSIDTAELVTNSQMESDCDDIRFEDSSNISLDYYLESGCNTNDTVVWVEVPSITASSTETISFYHGNSTVSSESSGVDTFDYFTDFDDIDDWTKVFPTSVKNINATGGYLIINNSGSYHEVFIRTNDTFDMDSKAMENHWESDSSSGSDEYDFMCFGDLDVNNGCTANASYHWYWNNRFSIIYTPNFNYSTFVTPDPYIWTQGIYGDFAYSFHNYSFQNTVNSSHYNFSNRQIWLGSQAHTSKIDTIDWFRVRDFVYPEVTSSVEGIDYTACPFTNGQTISANTSMNGMEYCENVSLTIASGVELDCNGANFTDLRTSDDGFVTMGNNTVLRECVVYGYNSLYPSSSTVTRYFINNTISTGTGSLDYMFEGNEGGINFINNTVVSTYVFCDQCGSGNVVIRGNTFRDNWAREIGTIRGGTNIIEDNYFGKPRSFGKTIGIFEDGVIRNNFFNFTNHNGAMFYEGIDATISNVEIYNNTFNVTNSNSLFTFNANPNNFKIFQNNFVGDNDVLRCQVSCNDMSGLNNGSTGNYYSTASTTDVNSDGFADDPVTSVFILNGNDSNAYVDYNGWLQSYTPNTAPSQATFTSPSGENVFDDNLTIVWGASTDSENDTIYYNLSYSTDNSTWTVINQTTATSYDWDVSGLSNGLTYIQIRAEDDNGLWTGWNDPLAGFHTTTFDKSTGIALDWSTLPTVNMTYQSADFDLDYNISDGEFNVTCELEIDSVLNQSQIHTGVGVYDFTVDADGLSEGFHTFEVLCSNAKQTDISDGVKTIYLDFTIPSLTINSPAINSSHYIINGLPIDALITNVELAEVSLVLFDENGTVTFNDTVADVVGNETSRNYTINSSDLRLGDMRFYLYVSDEASLENSANYSLRMYGCSELTEDWEIQYTLCNVSDLQTIYYTDANSCDTTWDLPVDNGTLSACNYCTAVIQENVSECFYSLQDFTYTLVNNATCCQVTGIFDDCDIPPDRFDEVCTIFNHTAEDISSVAVDIAVETGIEATKLAPLVAISSVAIFILMLL